MIRIPKKIDYTIKVLEELKKENRKAPLNLKEIAKRNKISEKYLKQIMPYLEEKKIVKSIKGPGGGYVLNKSLKNISLLDIFNALKIGFEIAPCMGEKGCVISKNCYTKNIWMDLNLKIKNFLKSKKIERIILKK
ncbi:MAG: Rrf2 family transcriptional regulator [candidate division WOR-3 bacterium]